MKHTASRSTLRDVLATIATLALAAALLTGCGSDSSSSSDSKSDDAAKTTESSSSTSTSGTSDETSGEVVEVGVVEGEMKFDPDSLTAKAGTVTFEFTNSEAIPHDFVIERDGEKIGATELISDDAATLTVDLTAGEYEFYCTPHRAIGMTGTLQVS